MSIRFCTLASAFALLIIAAPAGAQTSSPSQPPSQASPNRAHDWKFTFYPVLAWVPSGVDIDINIPPVGGGEGGDAGFSGQIIDSRFDGAYLGGFSADNGTWRIDATGMWAAVGGDRPQLPKLEIDVDAIYFHVTGGRKIAGDIYATAGVRRLALKYDILAADQYQFERKPGVWDPLVGLGWHTLRDKWEFHGTAEVGGFGAGTDVETAVAARLDWKPIPHFGVTGGYQWLYFKVEDDVLNRPFTVKQTLHGPMVGIGLYF